MLENHGLLAKHVVFDDSEKFEISRFGTRNSPPGAAGAEGHPFGAVQVGRSQRASRAAHDVRYADVRPLRGRVEHGSNYEFGVYANSFMKFIKIESGLGRGI